MRKSLKIIRGYLMTAYSDYDPGFVEDIRALAENLEFQAKEIEVLKNKIAKMENDNLVKSKDR